MWEFGTVHAHYWGSGSIQGVSVGVQSGLGCGLPGPTWLRGSKSESARGEGLRRERARQGRGRGPGHEQGREAGAGAGAAGAVAAAAEAAAPAPAPALARVLALAPGSGTPGRRQKRRGSSGPAAWGGHAVRRPLEKR